MRREQRIFRGRVGFTLLVAVLMTVHGRTGVAKERLLIADDKISIELADGWKKTDLNQGDVMAGFATQDNRSSMFFTEFQSGGSLSEIIDNTIINFEARFQITSEEKAVTGQVGGPLDKKWSAVFKTFEVEMEQEAKVFPLKFYLLVFDTGTKLYLLQASTTLPVREAREKQILEMIRSLVAKP